MVFVRLIVLLFLVFYSYTTGMSTAATSAGGSSTLMHVVFFVALAALYLLPIYEAAKRRHPSILPISLVDLFLGWTVVGWIVSLVWAVRKPEPVRPTDENSPYEIVEEPASRYPANSTAEALRDLAKLRAEGAITEEEYTAAKARVVTPR